VRAYEVLSDPKEWSQYEALLTLRALRKEKLARGRAANTREKSSRFEARTAGSESKKTPLERDRDRTRTTPSPSPRTFDPRRYDTEARPRGKDAFYKPQRPTRKLPSRSGLKGVSGYIGRHKVTALCNTGAHENCIRRQYVEDLSLEVRKLEPNEPRSFVMGHGKQVQVLGAVEMKWKFATDSMCVDITL
jgi:hypothetical protein